VVLFGDLFFLVGLFAGLECDDSSLAIAVSPFVFSFSFSCGFCWFSLSLLLSLDETASLFRLASSWRLSTLFLVSPLDGCLDFLRILREVIRLADEVASVGLVESLLSGKPFVSGSFVCEAVLSRSLLLFSSSIRLFLAVELRIRFVLESDLAMDNEFSL
jgi:hypothetical protein